MTQLSGGLAEPFGVVLEDSRASDPGKLVRVLFRAGTPANDLVRAESMLTRAHRAVDAAALRIVASSGCALVELLPRLAYQVRQVGPATPAPEGSFERHRLVVDDVPAWEGGWDATAPLQWEWRERWLADPERFAR